MRVGLIGASRIGVPAIIAPARDLPGVTVLGVAARDQERAREFAAAHGLERAWPNYSALIDDPAVDLVYIGTPPCTHRDLALAAIRAGKPALVEKPFAMTAAEADEVRRAAATAGVVVVEAMHSPHHALFGRVLEIVRGGALGPLRRLHARFDAPIAADDPIRWARALGGGALMDLGVYPLAWMRRVAGEDFTVIRAEAAWRRGVDAEVAATLLFAAGVEGELHTSMIAEKRAAELVIEGELGRLIVINPLAPQLGHRLTLSIGARDTTETVAGRSTYEAQLRAVQATVMEGEMFPFPADDYVRSMAAIDRVRAALPGG